MAKEARGTARRGWAIAIACAGVLASVVLLDRLVFAANRTVSPTRAYEVSYNRITRTITTRHIGTGTTWLLAECDDPAFLWSPNGMCLARNVTDANGNRRADIEDLERSVACIMPTKATIQEAYEETRTQTPFAYECIEIAEWLDDERVRIEFSWPSDAPGESIHGSLVYAFRTYAIQDITVRL